MRLSFSKVQTYLTCGRKYYYQYVKGIRPTVTNVALPFGKAMHKACTDYIASLALGVSTNPVKDFIVSWQEETEALSLEYPTHWDYDSMTDAGRLMCERFPAAWDQTGLIAVLDENGVPLVEQKTVVPLPGGKHHLVFVMDVLTLHLLSGAYAPLDLKTASQDHSENFGINSAQLTIYQLGVDLTLSRWLGSAVSNVGFMDLLKRKASKSGTGPLVQPPRFYPRRSREAVTEVIHQLNHVADQIEQKRFYRPMNSSFDSPCNHCEFARMCIHNDSQGYVTQQSEAA